MKKKTTVEARKSLVDWNFFKHTDIRDLTLSTISRNIKPTLEDISLWAMDRRPFIDALTDDR